MPCFTHSRALVVWSLLLVLAVPSSAGAWGAGHVAWQRALIDVLPADFRRHLSPQDVERSIHVWSKYIDSFDGFESQAELIGADGMAILERDAVDRRYDLHHDVPRAVNFILLVEALRAERYDAALFWIAALGHSTADMAATNHDPLLHLATYDWSHLNASPVDGAVLKRALGTLDLAHTAGHDQGLAAFEQAIARMQLADDGRSADEAMLEIMMYGHEGAAFCSRRGSPLFAAALAWATEDTAATRATLFEPIAELGAWAVVRTARDVQVAMRLAASSDARLEITGALRQAFTDRVHDHLRTRQLADEALYAPVLRPLREDGQAVVGVALEPTWRMNDGMLGFSDRTTAVAVCRTLEAMERPYATLDLRDIVRDGLPTPDRMSALILPARRLHSYHWLQRQDLDAALQRYQDAGGHVCWIGGTSPPVAAGPLAQALQGGPESQWPMPPEQLVQARLHVVGTDRSWPIVRNPNTPAGWHRPYGPLHLREVGEAVRPLVELRRSDRRITVGAVWESEGGRVAWLPTYALQPYLLTEITALEDLAQIRLDEAGTDLLRHVLKILESAE